MTKFKLHCEIEAGWASLCFSEDRHKDVIFFSHFVDGLEKLADATLALNNGKSKVETHLFADAESFVFDFSLENGSVGIRLFNFHEWTENQPLENIENRGNLLFEGECSLERFTRQIVQLFAGLKRVYGEDGYATKWGNTFPKTQLERLKAILLRRRIGFLAMILL
ncbi:MAG: hypothetical protein ACI81T_003250 [Bacteroidia bacterium]|jgi:hypothetical protein